MPQEHSGTSRWVAVAFWAIAVGALWLGLREWLPPLFSRHGAGIDRTLKYLLVATGSMLVIGHAVLGYLIWRFGGSDRVTSRQATAKLERRLAIGLGLLIVVIAEGGVLAMGMSAWREFYAAKPPADAVRLELTGEQFAWNMRYPGSDGEFGKTFPQLMDVTNPLGLDPNDPSGRDDWQFVNNMYVEEGRAVHITLRSKDVIHSLFLPHFRVKQDAVPGMAVDVWFVPTRAGKYELACTELCGLGHYRMRAFLHVLPAAEFAAWEAEQRSASG